VLLRDDSIDRSLVGQSRSIFGEQVSQRGCTVGGFPTTHIEERFDATALLR
jgi:hypothetical protein